MSVKNPSLHSTEIPTFLLISSIIIQTFSKSSVLGSLHAATRQNELAPSFFAFSACSTISSGGGSSYQVIFVLKNADCEQNVQSSLQKFFLMFANSSISTFDP